MILGSTLDMGVGPFLFFHTVNLVVQSLPLEYYTTKINSLPVILEIISLFKEQMVSHKRSTTFSNVENNCRIHPCESLSKSAQSDSFPVYRAGCETQQYFQAAPVQWICALPLRRHNNTLGSDGRAHWDGYCSSLNLYLEAIFITQIQYIISLQEITPFY